jgi:hypothetical protein
VVCRSGQPLADVAVINDRDEGLIWSQSFAGNWQVGQYEGDELARNARNLLSELLLSTGAPALTGVVYDSDCVDVEAISHTGGHWRACLDREAMAAYLEDEEIALEDRFLDPDTACDRAMAWASEAGLPAPNLTELHDLLASGTSDPIAEGAELPMCVMLQP